MSFSSSSVRLLLISLTLRMLSGVGSVIPKSSPPRQALNRAYPLSECRFKRRLAFVSFKGIGADVFVVILPYVSMYGAKPLRSCLPNTLLTLSIII